MTSTKKIQEASIAATTLGAETSFSGTLRFKDSLRIRGKFQGEIDATGRLYIDSEAVVDAKTIRATSVVVGGTVHGDIEAADRIEMLPSAKVYGNVRTARLRISDGVIFEGACEMIRNPEAFSPFSGSVEESR
jgi:cytoskeletal protein CcmA (bactofilin family)